MQEAKWPRSKAGTPRTRRQRIMELLQQREHGFEELRLLLQVPVRELEEDLRHVERSARHSPLRLIVTPSRCLACDYVFRDRAPRRFHPPGRCPRCRGERIEEPRLRMAGGGPPPKLRDG